MGMLTGSLLSQSILPEGNNGLASDKGTLTLMVSDPRKLTMGLLIDTLNRAAIQYPVIEFDANSMLARVIHLPILSGLMLTWLRFDCDGVDFGSIALPAVTRAERQSR